MPPRSLVLCILALALAVAAWSEPRAACVYSSFKDGGYWYRGEHKALFEELGWALDEYQNTQIADLADGLDQYAIVVFNTAYNYAEAQDFSQHAEQWMAYLESGGCLVVTDANYGSMFAWLAAVEPSLVWRSRGQMNEWHTDPPATVRTDHPLMAGVTPPRVPWTYPSAWSQGYTPLVVDASGRPVVAYREIGKGIVVTSSAYRQNGWPTASFLRNLFEWAADEGRQAAVAKREADEKAARETLPELSVPVLGREPIIDGEIGDAEWQDAAVIPRFVDMQGNSNLTRRTTVRVGQGEDGLLVAFECFDADAGNLRANIRERDGALWTDDCVELFLDPAGKRESYLHFIVNAAGALYDERGGDPSWSRYWVAEVGRRPGAWCAEVYVPFAALDISVADPPGDTWAANFNRECPTRNGRPQELSGWSPTFGNFGVSSHFGVLRGMKVDVDGYPAQPEIAASAPGRWYLGDNPIEAQIAAAGGEGLEGALELVELRSGERTTVAQDVTVAGDATASIEVRAAIASDVAHEFQLVLRDLSGRRILASSAVLAARPAPVMDVSLVAPAFRGSVQSKDPVRELWLKAFVGASDQTGLRLRASLTPEGSRSPVWQEIRPVQARSDAEIRSSLASIAEGKYTLRVDLEDSDYHLKAHETLEVSVLPPAPTEVTFGPDRVCYVNGKPFFPIGLYHVSEPVVDIVNKRAREIGLPEITVESMLRDCGEHGFNCVVRGWGMPGEAFLAEAEKAGLWVMPEVGSPSAEDLAKMVDVANRYGNVLMWYGVDEPMGEKLDRAMDAHQRFAAADPHRPVSAALNTPAMLGGAMKAYDLLMMDPYFIRNAPLSNVANWVDAAMKAGEGRAPIWMVPQAFAIDSTWEEPTNEELRCQTYLCITHGATGLVWYAYFTTEKFSGNPKGRDQWFLPDSHLWPYFTKLNAEISALTPVILEGERLGPVECDSDAVHTFAWEKDGQRTLIAVNALYEDAQATLKGLRGDEADVLGEDRKLPVRDGAVTDSFKPLAVHIYRY